MFVFDWQTLVAEQFRYVLAAAVLLVGLVTGYLVGRVNERLLRAAGVPSAVEGTSVERTARSFNTSTVSTLARISSWVIYLVAILLALQVANLVPAAVLWTQVTTFVPRVVVALAVLVTGLIVGDKVELVISEWLRGVKLPESGVVPKIVKYSIVFVAVLVALGQLGVAVGALIVLFAAYAAALIVFTALATKDILTSATAGIYLLLRQPYSIGDRVRIGDSEGIVQDVNIYVTHIEDEGTEYIVPNRLVFREGVVRIRE